MQLIKCMRRNARVTCWGWPLTSWQADVGGVWRSWNNATSEVKQATFDRWKACEQVWRHFDWWTPSAYDSWPLSLYGQWYQDMHRAAVTFRQQLCQRLNGDTPIITSVWPRGAHHPDDPLRYRIPCHEIAGDQVDAALAAGAAGVVWWGAPKFYYERGQIPKGEIEPGRPWDEVREHFDGVHREHFDCLLNAALGLDPHARRPIEEPIDRAPGGSG